MPNTALDIVVDTPTTNKEESLPKNASVEPVSVLEQEEDKKTSKNNVDVQDISATSTVRHNPVYGLEEVTMDNYSHIDKRAILPSTRGPQAFLEEHSSAQTIISASQGDKEAQVTLDDMYRDGNGVPQDYQTAMEGYLKTAEQGDAVGQFKVGCLYNFGLGVFWDPLTAMERYLKAASLGDAYAQRSIGTLYEKWLGDAPNYAKVLDWYLKTTTWFLKTTKQGHSSSQYSIGILYDNVWGVPKTMILLKDDVQAMDWILKAASQGNSDAQFNISVLYENGQGVPQSFAKAAEWYQKAANQGSNIAKTALSNLMTSHYIY
ncbi:hypothetical protein BGZ47_011020 [Haplosporangium gracile]|nr:hypothetical protein BGZ47_011020 [Haplosporangium gracile]